MTERPLSFFGKDEIVTHPELGTVWVKVVSGALAIVQYPGLVGWESARVIVAELTFVKTMEDAMREELVRLRLADAAPRVRQNADHDPNAEPLLNGTSGRPAFGGFFHNKHGQDIAWWTDGSRAFLNEQGNPMPLPPLDYDALFTTVDAAPAAVPVPVADAAEPNGLHPSYCECPFPAPKRGNMICGTCEGWLRVLPPMEPCMHEDCRVPNPVGTVVCRACQRCAR